MRIVSLYACFSPGLFTDNFAASEPTIRKIPRRLLKPRPESEHEQLVPRFRRSLRARQHMPENKEPKSRKHALEDSSDLEVIDHQPKKSAKGRVSSCSPGPSGACQCLGLNLRSYFFFLCVGSMAMQDRKTYARGPILHSPRLPSVQVPVTTNTVDISLDRVSQPVVFVKPEDEYPWGEPWDPTIYINAWEDGYKVRSLDL